ncbi:carbohydrate ABC transporter permease [Enterococcus sp. BWB1-3]|uniref:carbohydrate ABC transporter permease n=1 Tax=unclassified Enterococcus TaxID=2608891 RepID=UPI0019247B9F|nr:MULTISPECIES: carbohydrate ABC transporter permease [unclassified Enterococcus]MBL1229770.1 carbohydrate ABC transporter permease [Enterococcus sp. BWB1-3]MCB5953005.1 carbohydrate ABC transporter permease [Enterococcus sp. BWT-B8]MCB5956268.1 carbohydrate ABC transporter permease [Enterococcus sp. CWB-B31]
MKKTKKQQFFKILLYVILILYALITFYPFIWAVAASFKPLKEIVSGGMNIFGGDFTLANYQYILGRSENFPRWFMNSLIVSIIGTAVNLFLNTMAGYALARITFPGRERIYWGMLAMMMVPAQVLLIPNYLIISSLGMKDSFTALILPAAINIGNIFMMRQFFLSFPQEVEEAATIDGLSRTGTFFRIVMPLAKPSISTQAVFVFMGFWNEFLKPMLYMTTPSKYTLTLGLQTFKSQNAGQRWDQIMPASIISIIPIVILYVIFNKYFLQGVRMDGEK